jgi:hypothetical protein
MDTTIKDLGGLPAGEIEVLVLKSEKEIMTMLDTKLDGLKNDMSDRLDAHEGTVKARLDSQDAVQDSVLALVKSIDAKVDKIGDKGDGWHSEDLAYRASMEARVSTIEGILRSIKIWIMTFRAMAALRRGVIYIAHESKQYVLLVTALTSVSVFIVQFFHVVWPVYLHPWIKHYISHR